MAEPLLTSAVFFAVHAAANGLVGNRADGLVCSGLQRGWTKLRELQATDPVNHDLQRAARRAYLLAAREMAENSGAEWAVASIDGEIRGLAGWYAEQPIAELDVLLVDERRSQTERVEAFRASLAAMLAVDVRAWGGERADKLNAAFERGLRVGWGSERRPRTFEGVMAMHFLEAVKNDQPARVVLQTTLLAEIVNQDQKLAPLADLAKLDTILGALDRVPGKTAEAVVQTLRDQGVLQAEAPFCRLDAHPASFIDRPQLAHWLDERIAEGGGACLLWGGPGTGKSSLALVAGYRAHAAGRTVVQQFCGPDKDAERIGVELAQAILGPKVEGGPDEIVERARAWLRERRALVILDDVWRDDATTLAPGPPAFVLYTSRRETVGRLPAAGRRAVGGFEPEESEALIEARLPGWLTTDGDALREFARRIEHLPYALEVAVRLLEGDTRPRAAALAWVRDQALRDGDLDVDRLLRAAVEALPEDARKLLAAVALCAPAGVWLPFAGEVAGLEEEAWRKAASETRDASLLIPVDREEEQYRVHALLRDVLKEQARVFQEARAKVLLRLLALWAADSRAWLRPSRALSEARVAAEWLASNGFWDGFSVLTQEAWRLAFVTGRYTDALHLVQLSESCFGRQDDRAKLAAAWGNRALTLRALGRLEEALELHTKEGTICAEMDDARGLAASLGNQASIIFEMGFSKEAMTLFKQQADLYRKREDWGGLAASWGNQGLIWGEWGRPKRAIALHRRAARAYLRIPDRLGAARSWMNEAVVLRNCGCPEEAQNLFLQAEQEFEKQGDRAGLARCWANHGSLLVERGNKDDGRALWERAAAMFDQLGMVRERDRVLIWLEKNQ